MRYKQIFLLIVFLLFANSFVMAETFEVNYNSSQTGTSSESKFFVKTLKYEPYPVHAGEWFDLWVKVQNIGALDSRNTIFELELGYPFSSEDTLREYGLIPGTVTALYLKQTGEKDVHSNQVIMKFRVKVADNAPEGESILKLNARSEDQGRIIYDLPIEIGKTKTNFDVVMQDSNAQGTSFAIVNTGENSATAVTFEILAEEGTKISGSKSYVVGNLDEGDFTTITFEILPDNHLDELMVEIDYTDNAGIRNTIVKTVEVDIDSNLAQQFSNTGKGNKKTTSPFVYILIGIILTIAYNLIYKRIKKKK